MNPTRVEPTYVDVAIIGGSNAGLSATLTLGRARRSAAVIDDAAPRNGHAGHAHNVYTRDGTPPDELRRIGREQLEPYGVRILKTRVVKAEGSKGAFCPTLADGEPLTAARLLATGIVAAFPTRRACSSCGEQSIFTCPYCHGWEVRDLPLAVLGDGDAGYAYARLIHNWSRDLVLVTGEHTTLTGEQRDDLQARDIGVLEASVITYESRDGELSALRLSDGRRLERRAVFMRPPIRLRGDLPQQLGCTLSDDGLRVVVDEMG
jgi:thioredoxin reductase